MVSVVSTPRGEIGVIDGEFVIGASGLNPNVTRKVLGREYLLEVSNTQKVVINEEFLSEKIVNIRDCSIFINEEACNAFYDRGWLAFTHYASNNLFYCLWDYDYLEIDNFEEKYSIGNNNIVYYYYDDEFYVKEFGDYSYIIANTDSSFDFSVDMSFINLLTSTLTDYYCYGFGTAADWRVAIVKDKNNNKIYYVSYYEPYEDGSKITAIELKPYRKLF